MENFELLNEDICRMAGYYESLNESIEVKLRYKKKDKKIEGEKLEARKKQYAKYVKKRKAANKEVLSFAEWLEKVEMAKDLKKEAAKAGIKIAIAGAGAAVAHNIKTRSEMKDRGLDYKKKEDRRKNAEINKRRRPKIVLFGRYK